MILIGYGRNNNRLEMWEKVDWMIYHNYYVQYNHFMSLSDKEPVTVSVVTTVHTLTKKREIKNPRKTL